MKIKFLFLFLCFSQLAFTQEWGPWITIYEEGVPPNSTKVQVSFKLSTCAQLKSVMGYSFFRTNNEFSRPGCYLDWQCSFTDCDGKEGTEKHYVDLGKKGIDKDYGNWFLAPNAEAEKLKFWGSCSGNTSTNTSSSSSNSNSSSTSTISPETYKNEIAPKMDKAEQLRKDKQYADAEKLYDEVLAIDPSNSSAKYGKSVCEQQKKNQQFTDDCAANNKIAKGYADNKQYTEAINKYVEVLNKCVGNAEAQAGLDAAKAEQKKANDGVRVQGYQDKLQGTINDVNTINTNTQLSSQAIDNATNLLSGYIGGLMDQKSNHDLNLMHDYYAQGTYYRALRNELQNKSSNHNLILLQNNKFIGYYSNDKLYIAKGDTILGVDILDSVVLYNLNFLNIDISTSYAEILFKGKNDDLSKQYYYPLNSYKVNEIFGWERINIQNGLPDLFYSPICNKCSDRLTRTPLYSEAFSYLANKEKCKKLTLHGYSISKKMNPFNNTYNEDSAAFYLTKCINESSITNIGDCDDYLLAGLWVSYLSYKNDKTALEILNSMKNLCGFYTKILSVDHSIPSSIDFISFYLLPEFIQFYFESLYAKFYFSTSDIKIKNWAARCISQIHSISVSYEPKYNDLRNTIIERLSDKKMWTLPN